MVRRRKNMDDEVTLESQDGADAHEEVVDEARTKYDAAIDAIACGTKKLTEAGMQATSAGPIAHEVWCKLNGISG